MRGFQFRPLFRLSAAAALAAVAASAGLAAAAPLNIFTPDLQQLKKDYLEEKGKVAAARHDALKALLDEGAAHYAKLHEQHKVTGNISGLAIALTGIRGFDEMKEQLEKTRDFKWPERIRREMETHFEGLKARKKGMDEKFTAAVKEVEDKWRAQFAERCKAQGADVSNAAKLQEWFTDLVGSEDRPAGATAGTGGAAAAASNAVSEEVSVQGVGSNWVPFARWYASIGSMEVIEVPVMNRRTEETNKTVGAEGAPVETRYFPIRELTPAAGYAFRVRGLRGKQSAVVVSWPTQRNKWRLSLRLRPGRDVPSQHAVELQVTFPGAEALPLIAGVSLPEDGAAPGIAGAAGGPVTLVAVSVQTVPEGAMIAVDGLLMETNGVAHRTPCTVQIPAGRHDIALKKFGFKDAVFRNFMAEAGRGLAWNMQRDPKLVEKNFQVSARSRWRDSGISVSPGEVVMVDATGTWSCGSKGEPVGAEGYPNDSKFFHYYTDPRANPRQVPKFNYGALLMRVGPSGTIVGVTRDFKAQIKSAGTLYFDINEAEGPARNDNQGALNVHVLKGQAPR
jgi:hypothetical protein